MKELIISNVSTLTNGGEILCVDATIINSFKDGKYTKDVDGVKYLAVIPALQYQRIEIRTKEKSPNPRIVQALEAGVGAVPVDVENFRAKVSIDWTRKELRLTCIADSVEESEVII